VGVVGLAAFIATGQFMDRRLDHLVGMADGPRALYRSGHIYILFAALLNLLLGAYLVPSTTRGARLAQYVSSALIMTSLILFVYGFAIETPLGLVERPMVRKGIYLCLAGVLVSAGAKLLPGAQTDANEDTIDAL
jgi:hypothetical protein